MQRIHNIVLEPKQKQTITTPANAVILSARKQGEQICVWYLFDVEDDEIQRVTFYIEPTGSLRAHNKHVRFLDTVMYDDDLVFHVFMEENHE